MKKVYSLLPAGGRIFQFLQHTPKSGFALARRLLPLLNIHRAGSALGVDPFGRCFLALPLRLPAVRLAHDVPNHGNGGSGLVGDGP
jgi:hypothetical protein